MDVAMSAGRLLVYHKHATSARTRFISTAQQGIVLFAPLPPLSSLGDESAGPRHEPRLVEHPAQLVSRAVAWLGLASGAIELDGHHLGWVETPQQALAVHLAHFTAIDPPCAAAEARGARFITLTEARHLSAIELELLRRAYCYVLGG